MLRSRSATHQLVRERETSPWIHAGRPLPMVGPKSHNSSSRKHGETDYPHAETMCLEQQPTLSTRLDRVPEPGTFSQRNEQSIQQESEARSCTGKSNVLPLPNTFPPGVSGDSGVSLPGFAGNPSSFALSNCTACKMIVASPSCGRNATSSTLLPAHI